MEEIAILQGSCVPGWLQTQIVAKDDFELLTLVPPPPECWDYGHVPPWLVYVMLTWNQDLRHAKTAFYQLSYVIVLH